uniref:Uncharacterized protein n=1 Tax=viral metagenome TaxID=1070528 RepID=A0A6C0LDR3_9ZZZZ
MDVQKVRERWEQLRRDCDLLKDVGWSDQITKYDLKTARKLYRFREYLKNFIMKSCNLCDNDICTICNAVGSTKLTSDIDISINTEIHFSISIKRLLVLRNALRVIFEHDNHFHHRGKFILRLVNEFFDINFYLSNFELTKDATKKIGDFDRYFISDCYRNNCKNVVNQYYFASLEFNHPKIRRLDSQYLKISNELDELLHTDTDTKKINANAIINVTSVLSLYEDGSYHTQGSYFHIVMMNQKKIKFNIRTERDKQIYKNLLSASIIENLCYSWIYKKKRDKYLSRVKDGLDKLQQYHIKNKIFTPLELLELEKDINIKNEIDRILQKLSIYN